MTYSLARSLRGNDDYLSQYAETKRIYLNGGKFYNRRRCVSTARSSRHFFRLQKGGPNEFYEGQTARLIVDDMKRNNGLITMEDIRGYVAKER